MVDCDIARTNLVSGECRSRNDQRSGRRGAGGKLSKLGRLIHRARISTNLRQQELAKLSGVAQGDISRLEIGSGEKGPTFDTLVRLAHAQDMKLVVELVPNTATAEEVSSVEEEETENGAQVLRAAF
jgi:transcriptional regulator with XRE-family HTH domain